MPKKNFVMRPWRDENTFDIKLITYYAITYVIWRDHDLYKTKHAIASWWFWKLGYIYMSRNYIVTK